MAQSRGDTGPPPVAQATILFNGGDFDGAIGVLQRAAQAKKGKKIDPRIEQNVALSKFAKSECAAGGALLQSLSVLLPPRSAKAGDDESKTGSAVDETVDRSVVMYNYAVALYHMRQFESAHRLLDSLVGSVLTPVDEHLAMRASFLMLDMYATGYRGAVQSDQDVSAVYESAMRLVAWLEEPHSFNGGAGGAGGDRSGSKDTDQVADFRFRLHLAKARMELLVGNQKACKKELKTALEIYQKDFANEDGTGSSKGAGAGAVWGKDGTFIGDPNDKNAAALVLKAQLECQRRNYSKSLRLLGSCHASDGGLDPVVYLNNLGCIYSHLKRDQAAALHFSRALKMCSASSRGQFYASPAGSMLTVRAPSPTCEVFYNAGLSMLRSGQGAAALRCLKRAALLFRHRARLWVRMAEACIVEHEKRRQARRAARDVQSTSWAAAGVVSQVAGRGRTRRMLVECKDDAAEAAAAATGAGDEDCSLAFAAQCLRNCLSLLHDGTAHEAKPEGAEGSSSDAGAHQTSILKQAAFCKLAYVSLALGDTAVALDAARSLLTLPTCQEPWRYRGRLYASEALCRLGRPDDVAHLLTQQALVEATGGGERPVEGALSPPDATAAFFVNLGSMCILRGDLLRARQCARQALVASPSSTEARRLSVYLSLRCGEARDALSLLKLGQIPDVAPPATAQQQQQAQRAAAGAAGAGASGR